MELNIKFDSNNNPEEPNIILGKKNGDIFGKLNAKSIDTSISFVEKSEISFNVHKKIDNKVCEYWDEIVDFRLVFCKEWNKWFEIKVLLDEETSTTKTVYGTSLGEAELSQINLYDIQINTENDLLNQNVDVPIRTCLYNIENTKFSLIHRLLEKAPHYSVRHVDNTIAGLYIEEITFNKKSIYDAFMEIGEKLHCLFVFHSDSDEDGNILREFSVYDLDSYCNSCGHRDDFLGSCPKCQSEDIYEGYGKDTTIFITADELAGRIEMDTDIDSVKNCFKLEAGDDLITNTIKGCNPNGTDYIWYISQDLKSGMTPELVDKLDSYDERYYYYKNDHITTLDSTLLESYNYLVSDDSYGKYFDSDDEEHLKSIQNNLIGFDSIVEAEYNATDLYNFLKTSMMPSVKISDTSAEEELKNLTTETLSPISVSNIKNVSEYTSQNAITSFAKTLIDSRYKVEVIDYKNFTIQKDGNGDIISANISVKFNVINYNDTDKEGIEEKDEATSSFIYIIINGNYESFLKQKIEKELNKDIKDLSILGLFDLELSLNDFKEDIKMYSLSNLTSFKDAGQACLSLLEQQGVKETGSTWSDPTTGSESNLSEKLYTPYLNKIKVLEDEITVRGYDVDTVKKLLDHIKTIKNEIQNELDFQKYIGEELWLEFCSFRREDTYSNNSYKSKGLNNAELIDSVRRFIETAEKEIYKSAELQHSITTTLNNLLHIKKFKPLIKDFCVGNWLRISIDDKVYKLRLIHYNINFDSINQITVNFSDVLKVNDSSKKVEETFSQVSSMASSYSSVQRQAEQGSESNDVINSWKDFGLDATNVKIINGADNQTQSWDKHGMLFREYDDITDSYLDEQMKIVNSTIAITDDNWKSIKTAIGKFYLQDENGNLTQDENGNLKITYGINAETIKGRLLLGEQLRIVNNDNNETNILSFDGNGLKVTNNISTFHVDPNHEEYLLSIYKEENGEKENIFNVGKNGGLFIGNSSDVYEESSSDPDSSDVVTPSGGSVTDGSSDKLQKYKNSLEIKDGKITIGKNAILLDTDNYLEGNLLSTEIDGGVINQYSYDYIDTLDYDNIRKRNLLSIGLDNSGRSRISFFGEKYNSSLKDWINEDIAGIGTWSVGGIMPEDNDDIFYIDSKTSVSIQADRFLSLYSGDTLSIRASNGVTITTSELLLNTINIEDKLSELERRIEALE